MRPSRAPVDPAIAAAVGDVGRPVRHFPFSRDLDHLPGRTGLVAGFTTFLKMVRQGEAFFTSEYRRYGPVFREQVGPDPIVCVADAQMNWDMGVNRDGVWSSALPWAYLLGGADRRSATVDGPLATDGDFHLTARYILRPSFNAAALASYLEGATALFRERFRRWEAGRRFPFKAEVRTLLADVAAKMFLGIDDPAESAALDRATEDAWRAPQSLRKRSRLSPTWRRAMGGFDRLWAMLRPQVAARRAGNGVDMFSRMCRTETAGTWLDDDALVRLLISTMMAAFDTTSSGIASMGYLLCRHPDWQDRLREEARTLGDGAPTGEALPALEQHGWVWQETLRVFPVAGQLNRQALSETTVGGHRIPAGTYVLGLTGTTMWDPRYWTEPARFDPTRFSRERAEHKKHEGAYLPFGVGNHVCLGAQIATLEAVAFFSGLLSRYRIRLSPDYVPAHNYLPFGIVSGRLEMEIEPA